jgi:hypothetical protein
VSLIIKRSKGIYIGSPCIMQSWSRSTLLVKKEINITPIAKKVVKIMPIATSVCILKRFSNRDMDTAVIMEMSIPPIKKLASDIDFVTKNEMTIPGKTACDIASASMVDSLSTRNGPNRLQLMAISEITRMI